MKVFYSSESVDRIITVSSSRKYQAIRASYLPASPPEESCRQPDIFSSDGAPSVHFMIGIRTGSQEENSLSLSRFRTLDSLQIEVTHNVLTRTGGPVLIQDITSTVLRSKPADFITFYVICEGRYQFNTFTIRLTFPSRKIQKTAEVYHENLYKQEAVICSYNWLLRKVNHSLNYCQLSQYTASQSQFSWRPVLCGNISVFFLPTCLTFDAVRSPLSDQSTLTGRLDGLSCWLTLISSWFGFPGVIGAAWPCPHTPPEVPPE